LAGWASDDDFRLDAIVGILIEKFAATFAVKIAVVGFACVRKHFVSERSKPSRLKTERKPPAPGKKIENHRRVRLLFTESKFFIQPFWIVLHGELAKRFFGQMSLDHTGTQACFAPCVTRPLPAKKSTKLGAGGFMRSFEQLEGGLSKRDFEKREMVDC
jgi:hypothetical protein